MWPYLRKLKNWAYRHRRAVLWGSILAYIAVFSMICIWKYGLYLYNAIDLAYFNQVFWNMLHGRWFEGSIHPHSSLGDHAELIMPVLLPLYAIFPDPRTLLVLQTIALALPAWPLYLLAEKKLGRRSLLPLLAALLWLINPFLQNINLFEFHILPFALLPLLFALLEYEKKRPLPFLAWLVVALLVREDTALVIAVIGIVAWLEKRSWFWRLAPVLIAAGWFLGAMKLIAAFAPAGGYKFSIYYSWLGQTWTDKFWNLVIHPLRLPAHLLTVQNLEMVLGLLMPSALIFALVRPTWLLLALGPLLQIVLGAPGGGELILRTHYATLFLPALFLALVAGLSALPALVPPLERYGIGKARPALLLLLLLAAIYSSLVLGPVWPALGKMAKPGDDLERARVADEMVSLIDPGSPVAASYALLPQLSSRERLYSLHYHFLGITQFALTSYELPPDVRFTALDTDDLLTYRAQFRNTNWAAPHYAGGHARLREAAAGAEVFSRGNFRLFDAAKPRPRGATALRDGSVDLAGGIRFEGSRLTTDLDPVRRTGILTVQTSWSAAPGQPEGLAMRLVIKNRTGCPVLDRVFPPANSLFAPSELSPGPVQGEVVLSLSGWPAGTYTVEAVIEKLDGKLIMDKLGSTIRHDSVSEDLGSVPLGEFEIPGRI